MSKGGGELVPLTIGEAEVNLKSVREMLYSLLFENLVANMNVKVCCGRSPSLARTQTAVAWGCFPYEATFGNPDEERIKPARQGPRHDEGD